MGLAWILRWVVRQMGCDHCWKSVISYQCSYGRWKTLDSLGPGCMGRVAQATDFVKHYSSDAVKTVEMTYNPWLRNPTPIH